MQHGYNTMNNKELKKDFGWSQELQNAYFSVSRNIPSGSFQLKRTSGHIYWMFKKSKNVETRNIHLCKAYCGFNKDGQTSFQECWEILTDIFNPNHQSHYGKKKKVIPFIDEYIEFLVNEGKDPYGKRKMGTIKSMVVSLTSFKSFCRDENIQVEDIEKKKFRDSIRKYMNVREKIPVKRSTIRKNLIDIRSFINWLADDDLGKDMISEHFITEAFLIKNYPVIPKSNDHLQHYFSSAHYLDMYNECLDRIKDIWKDYCLHGHRKKSANQSIGIGTDIVYFIAFFQLIGGFRVGEILHAHKNFDSWKDRPDKKSASSFFEKEDGQWFLKIRDYKNRDGMVGIKDSVRMWRGRPPAHVPITTGKDDVTKMHYCDTNIVDVCNEIFPKSDFMFPSPNFRSSPNKSYSKTYYMNLFKYSLINRVDIHGKDNGWTRYGVNSSHDLRDYFISYCIANKIYSPYELSTITRHQLSTMEKYYVRLGSKEQFDLMMKMDQKELVRKKK